MKQVRTYVDALNAVEEYVDSAKSNIRDAITIAREIESADTADRDDIATLIHYLDAALGEMKE